MGKFTRKHGYIGIVLVFTSSPMPKLPFKTSPVARETVIVGNEKCGTLEIQKIYDLTPNERIFIEEGMRTLPDLQLETIKMARTIASSTGKKLVDVYNALGTNDTEILGEHLEELVKFNDLIDKNREAKRLFTVTAILRFRVLPEWTVEDTKAEVDISHGLVEEVYKFALNEQSGWKDVEVEPVTEEALGKSLLTEESKNQTGENSTIDVTLTSPMILDSAPIVLEASPVG